MASSLKEAEFLTLLLGGLFRSGASEVVIHGTDDPVEPSPVLRDRLKDDGAAVPPDAHLVRIEPELLGKPDSL